MTASADLTVRTWDAAKGKTLSILRPGSVVGSAVFSPNGSRIVSVSDDRTVRVWDSATGKEIEILRDTMRRWCRSVLARMDRDRYDLV